MKRSLYQCMKRCKIIDTDVLYFIEAHVCSRLEYFHRFVESRYWNAICLKNILRRHVSHVQQKEPKLLAQIIYRLPWRDRHVIEPRVIIYIVSAYIEDLQGLTDHNMGGLVNPLLVICSWNSCMMSISSLRGDILKAYSPESAGIQLNWLNDAVNTTNPSLNIQRFDMRVFHIFLDKIC